MFYDSLKIFHILSATLLLTSMSYCYYLWSQANRFIELAMSSARIQAQTWLVILPAALIQLISGFTLISLKEEDFSQLWIMGSTIGFIVAIGSWFSFIYFLILSQQLTTIVTHANSMKFKLFRRAQMIMLSICAIALFTMIFLMANKIQ